MPVLTIATLPTRSILVLILILTVVATELELQQEVLRVLMVAMPPLVPAQLKIPLGHTTLTLSTKLILLSTLTWMDPAPLVTVLTSKRICLGGLVNIAPKLYDNFDTRSLSMPLLKMVL